MKDVKELGKPLCAPEFALVQNPFEDKIKTVPSRIPRKREKVFLLLIALNLIL